MKNTFKLFIFILFIFSNNNIFADGILKSNITSDWGNGFCYNFNIENNTGKDLSNWKINFQLDENTTIYSKWSGSFSNINNNYTISGLDWNKTISPNNKIDIGFCANGYDRPINVSLDLDNVTIEPIITQPPEVLEDISITKDGLVVSFNTMSKWDGGYCRKIVLKNTTDKSISNWDLSFILDQDVIGWSANYFKIGNKYKVTPIYWNENINSNSQIEIGFCSIGESFDKNQLVENVYFTPQIEQTTTQQTTTQQTTTQQTTTIDSGILLKYPDDSWNPKSIDLNGDSKKDYILSLNPWNISSASGTATMSVDYINKKIIYNQDLTNISIKNPGGYVLSYPEIYVGNKPWGGEYFETDSKLPVKFSDLNDLQLKINYKANFEDGLNGNIAMEGWLTKNKFQTTGVGSGESEIMVWLYSNGLNPAGEKIGETTVNLKINGVNKNEIFEIYKGDIGWEIISYKPKNGGWISADIELNLKQLFDNFKLNTSNTNYDNLYLQDWEFGTETGTPTTTKAKYNFELSKYDVVGVLNTNGDY